MKITTIEQVLEQAEMFNKLIDSDQSTEIYIKTIKSSDDLKQLATQERGNFFEFEGYQCCVVDLGKIHYILTNKEA